MTRSWLAESTTRVMTTEEAAWLAGFFDGEGSLTLYMGGRGKKHPAWTLSVPNTHYGSLKKCAAITGAGNIVHKYYATEKRKEQWTWTVHKQRNIASILRQMFPFLTVKKARAEEFFSVWSDLP
jgi:hypothetical protein